MFRGCAGVGEPGQTVNLVFRLNRFESYHPHVLKNKFKSKFKLKRNLSQTNSDFKLELREDEKNNPPV